MAAFSIRHGSPAEHDRIRQLCPPEERKGRDQAEWDAYWARADVVLADPQRCREMVEHLDRVLSNEQAAISELESIFAVASTVKTMAAERKRR